MQKVFHALWSSVLLGDSKRRSVADLLRQIPVFKDLSPFELRFIITILHQRTYRSGELVFAEGEAGNGMYIIHSGSVRITGKSEEGEERLFTELQERQFFGELSLLDTQPRSANVVVMKPAVLYGFFKPDLVDLIRRQPALGTKILMNLATVLGDRLRDTNTRMMQVQDELIRLRGLS